MDVSNAKEILAKFTVCVLGYGDYRNYLETCIGSILRCVRSANGGRRTEDRSPLDIRVFVNEPSDDLRQYTRDLRDMVDGPDHIYVSPTNMLKYPAMRRMFYDASYPITTPYVMWFDDDTRILQTGDMRKNGTGWFFDEVAKAMEDADMLGVHYFKHLLGQQSLWIAAQPWYNGRPVAHNQKINFCTGGWWTIRREILERHNWPPENILHHGGDVMLGALMAQHDYRMRRFSGGLAVNADLNSTKHSSAKTRGYNKKNYPVGR